jgi:hypothetical protein
MTDKATTLSELDGGYHELREAIDGLDRDQMGIVWFDRWSVKDIVAHVLGWEREMTGALQRIARGERPTPEGVDYSDSDAWNAGFSLAYKHVLPPTVVAEWQQVHANYVKAAQAVPDDRYGVRDDGKPATVNRLLETSGYGHFREHAAQIKEWRQRAGL